ncbi:hypothetical protein like AT4G03500 [Hibiscus trionum]|uniref:PGG domain-containing protein n=1 Tax=Hibiscus trionum TaxID=183268 RepID=A0A9W7HNZ9_HIBTR|nr:hypothetical protein like AT4G03500 [Hibiscus trionum]
MSSDNHPVESIAALYEAAERGNIQVFNNYQGFELESLRANTKGQTLLHVAARHGHSSVVKFLIQFQAKTAHGDVEQQQTDVEAVRRMLRKTDLESNTALHIAVRYGRRELVQELLEFEDPDFPYSINTKQESPLYIAARRGDGPLLDMILEKLESVAHGGPHGRTALHAAAMAGDAEATSIILNKRRKLTKERDGDGHTPLHYAAHLGHSSVVEVLLGWDVSAAYATDKKWEMTPLLMAARQGHGHIVTKILSVCPDCCQKVDKLGRNLLHFVAFRNSPSSLSRPMFEDGGAIATSQCQSVRNLMDAKDVHGITPRQVYDASPFNLFEGSNTIKPIENMEQIVKMLEHIVNEEVADAPVRPLSGHIGNKEEPDENVSTDTTDSLVKARDAHFVVAALIATVTFAAAITVPGGYKSEDGSEQGTPFLIHDAAFKSFIITNALAFVFSLSAVSVHFKALPPFTSNPHDSVVEQAASLLYYAKLALALAFSTGTYVVLKPSHGLVITSCCIGLSFIFHKVIFSPFLRYYQ